MRKIALLLVGMFLLAVITGCAKLHGDHSLTVNAKAGEPKTEQNSLAPAPPVPQISEPPVLVTETYTPDPGGYRLIGDD